MQPFLDTEVYICVHIFYAFLNYVDTVHQDKYKGK